MAVRFNNSGQHYTRAAGMGSRSTLTVTCWGKLSVDRNAFSCFWNFDNGGSDYLLASTTDNGTTLQVFEESTATSGFELTVGTWYYIAFVLNGGSSRLFVRADGAPSGTTINFSGGTVNAANLRLGDLWFGGWLNGCLTSVKIWTAALSVGEVDAEYSSPGPVRTSDLWAWYNLVSPSTTDDSGNGRTLSGGVGTTTEPGPASLVTGPVEQEYTDNAQLTDTVTWQTVYSRTFDDSSGLTDRTTGELKLTEPDLVGLTDSFTIETAYSRTFDETVEFTDTHDEDAFPAGPTVDDSTGLTDSLTVSLNKTFNEDAGLDDVVAVDVTFDRVREDAAGLADEWGLSTTFSRGVEEDAGLADRVDAESTFVRAASDDASLSDSVTRSLLRSFDDLQELSDEATRVLYRTVEDFVGLRDGTENEAAYDRIIDESLGLVEDIETAKTAILGFDDSAGLTDDLEDRLWHKIRDDYLPIVDDFITVTTFDRPQTDDEELSDSFITAMRHDRELDYSVGLIDSLTRQLNRAAPDSAGLSDHVEILLFRLERIFDDAAGSTDNFTIARHRHQAATEDAGLEDDVVVSLVSQFSLGELVGLADQAVVGLTSLRGHTSDVGLTDSVTMTLMRTLSDTMTLADSYAAPVVFNRIATDRVGIHDNTTRATTFNRTLGSNAGLVDGFINRTTFGRTFNSSSTLTDDIAQARIWNRLFVDGLSIVSDFTRFASYTRSINDLTGLMDLAVDYVPTQREWDYRFGDLQRSWTFTGVKNSWRIGDLVKAWSMNMAEPVKVVGINPEDIEVTISGTEAGEPVDPTLSDQVHFAFLAPGTIPDLTTEWKEATWAPVDQPGNLPDLYKAICTVSGLTPGRYTIWVRVTHGEKQPTEEVGTLIVR